MVTDIENLGGEGLTRDAPVVPQPFTPPLFSPPVSEMKAFLCRQTSVSPLCAPRRAEARVAAFSGSVCCIFWFIYTLLIVAPHACQRFSAWALCVHYAGWVKNPIWNIHECMNKFIVEKTLYIREESHFLLAALLWNGVAWFLKVPHMPPPNRAAGAPLTQRKGRGKGNDLAPIRGAGAVASKQRESLRL